ncbi:MAG: 50S ribosomal protein L25/general stress protein Ctc [Tannerellaceae bacterium]|jgi:large subunit ribosomal protein L25|nr:50S ribosomal protein L25/general stress protein Ctc [Tannerellaceae bacterium]
MKFFQLEANPREAIGKKAARMIRQADGIPCILYGTAPFQLPFEGVLKQGEKVVEIANKKAVIVTHLSVAQDDVRGLLYTPEVYLVELNIRGSGSVKAIVKDLQTQPVTDEITHIDFQEIFEDKPIEIEIPIVLEGHSAGVKAGGKLSLEMRKLKVKALYKDLPEKLVIDITNLELGKTIQVGALKYDNLELMNASNAVVCAVKLTRAARGAAAAAASSSK